jgi:hypothetical protein
MTESIGSWPSDELASAAKPMTSEASQPGFTGRIALTTNSFWVSVPVLSQQITSTMAASFSEDSRVSSTPFKASVRAPKAAASVNVAGRATGTADSNAVRTSNRICSKLILTANA